MLLKRKINTLHAIIVYYHFLHGIKFSTLNLFTLMITQLRLSPVNTPLFRY